MTSNRAKILPNFIYLAWCFVIIVLPTTNLTIYCLVTKSLKKSCEIHSQNAQSLRKKIKNHYIVSSVCSYKEVGLWPLKTGRGWTTIKTGSYGPGISGWWLTGSPCWRRTGNVEQFAFGAFVSAVSKDTRAARTGQRLDWNYRFSNCNCIQVRLFTYRLRRKCVSKAQS